MNKKKKIAIVLFLCISVFLVLGVLMLSNGKDVVVYKGSSTALDKIRAGEKAGTTVILSKEEINEILAIYFKNGRTKDSVTIKGLNVDFSDEKIGITIPLMVQGVPLQVSTNGSLTYKDEKIKYTAEFYKVGKLPIPKGVVEEVVKKYSTKEVGISSGTIEISRYFLPFTIKSLQVVDNKVNLALEKYASGDLFSGISKVNSDIKKQEEKPSNEENESVGVENKGAVVKSNEEANLNSMSEKNESSNTAVKEENNDSVQQASDTEETIQSLTQVSGQLDGAIGQVETSKERQVIALIQDSINAVVGDSSHNYKADIRTVAKIYKTLTPEERKRVKNAIISNVDMKTAGQLKNTFGL